MKTTEEINEIVERIKKNIIGCAGCEIKDLVIDFLIHHNPAAKEAIMELAEYKESAHVQFLANDALKLYDQAENSAEK